MAANAALQQILKLGEARQIVTDQHGVEPLAAGQGEVPDQPDQKDRLSAAAAAGQNQAVERINRLHQAGDLALPGGELQRLDRHGLLNKPQSAEIRR